MLALSSWGRVYAFDVVVGGTRVGCGAASRVVVHPHRARRRAPDIEFIAAFDQKAPDPPGR